MAFGMDEETIKKLAEATGMDVNQYKMGLQLMERFLKKIEVELRPVENCNEPDPKECKKIVVVSWIYEFPSYEIARAMAQSVASAFGGGEEEEEE